MIDPHRAWPPLSRGGLDRAAALRDDTEALREGWPTARLLRVNGLGQVRLMEKHVLLEPASDRYFEPPEHAVLLGVFDGDHEWAVRGDEGFNDRLLPSRCNGSLGSRGAVEFGDLRSHGALLDTTDAERCAVALALLNWHDDAGFCSRDGHPTTMASAGWVRVCTKCGREEYPRTDPAVICLVHDGADRVLLARQSMWPTRRFSILAGFVEAGESLESCVAREVAEEVGLTVSDVQYFGSQPWPFPRSAMLGFHAVADPMQKLVFVDGEIAEAIWLTRAEVRALLAVGDWTSRAETQLLLPGAVSIARSMLEAWAADEPG
ncbi:NAD(+) diphosphatase (plasmid) [Rhodococcus qingshengii]|uniref:NAD(+) diphosphatase n=1 Tax=Rhodococcus TaxID=1827 RepID=UPI0006D20DDB|nr:MULTISPECIES: NAD(+) diphosphatase [Rhodococcus]MBW0292603.1 NADH pyrophosphatase [Rhodococcus sp. MH15]MCZ4618368.1 NAD(+) diphosphatase [Rhodococcus qingshengii]MEA1798639.1 NAD(+) diphosphatase [Rhodococcus qingshengii]BDQ24082.1 NAD(+) diphosphatase [Rhodococcus qingshengii]